MKNFCTIFILSFSLVFSKDGRLKEDNLLSPLDPFRQSAVAKIGDNPFPTNQKISLNLMNAFLDSNSVQGSYGTVNISVITPPLKSCQYQCTYCPHGPTT